MPRITEGLRFPTSRSAGLPPSRRAATADRRSLGGGWSGLPTEGVYLPDQAERRPSGLPTEGFTFPTSRSAGLQACPRRDLPSRPVVAQAFRPAHGGIYLPDQ